MRRGRRLVPGGHYWTQGELAARARLRFADAFEGAVVGIALVGVVAFMLVYGGALKPFLG